jgi:hypothetical protein
MIRQAKKLRKALEQYVRTYQDDDKVPPLLLEVEWQHIDYLIELLYPFSIYTDAVGATANGPTIQNVFEVYNRLFTHIETHISKLRRKKILWKKQMLEALQGAYEKLRSYYGQTQNNIGYIYAVGTILAPLYKASIFETPDWKDDKVNWVSSISILYTIKC